MNLSPNLRPLSVACSLLLFTSCRSPDRCVSLCPPAPHTPANVYQSLPHLPPEIRRVAVLPIASPLESASAESGQRDLAPVLLAELIETRRFEATPIRRDELRLWTSRWEWSGQETFPSNFFDIFVERGYDAVIIAELTAFRPYQPLMLGCRLKLVQTKPMRILWAADEIFDAGQPGVARAAREFYCRRKQMPAPLDDTSTILRSPRQFGAYAFGALFESLPAPSKISAKLSPEPDDIGEDMEKSLP